MYSSTSEPTLWEQMLLLFVVFIMIAPQCDRLSTGKKIQQRLLLLLLLFHVVLIITANKMICYVNSISHSRLNTFSISFFFNQHVSFAWCFVKFWFTLHSTWHPCLLYIMLGLQWFRNHSDTSHFLFSIKQLLKMLLSLGNEYRQTKWRKLHSI